MFCIFANDGTTRVYKKVVSKLISHIPQLSELRNSNQDNSKNIEAMSGKGNLSIWIGTEEMEITIGLTGKESSDWHMHLNRFKERTLDEAINKAISFIQSILDNKRIIFYSNIYGYTLNNEDYVLNNKQPSEIIQSRYWSDI